jgi:hypothetical protein
MKEAQAAFQSAPPERSISGMPVVVPYYARIGRVILGKRGEDYQFTITTTADDESTTESWNDLPRNVYAIRDEFQKVKTPTEAFDFLSNTGRFSPLGDRITWSEFQRWQRFAYLIQEHDLLAKAMNNGDGKGECAEVLKALTGIYPTTFFDMPSLQESPMDATFRLRLETARKQNPELDRDIKKGEHLRIEWQRNLWRWFLQAPGKACSIHWIPVSEEFDEALDQKLQCGGAMIEFLMPREQLRPVLFIRPSCTLEAIAAAIYADRINGLEYKACIHCKSLFRVGSHKTKTYCDKAKCKNTAHLRRTRSNKKLKQLNMNLQSRPTKSKGGK